MTQEELNRQMIKAADNRDTKTVRKMLEQGADPNSRDNSGYTALMYACQYGRTDTAGLLLEHGADPNVQDNYGETALTKACWWGYTDTAGLLLEHGADPNVQDNSGETALTTECSNPKVNRDVITALITAGAELDKRNNNSMTALMQAALGGHTRIMELLIQAGADISIGNSDGKTAFDMLKEDHPEQYDQWIRDTAVKHRKTNLKREDSTRSQSCTPDYDI